MSAVPSPWHDCRIRRLIDLALSEDIGSGDVTTEACVPETQEACGHFLAKQDLVLAGTPMLDLIYTREQISLAQPEGSEVEAGTAFARISGTARRLLTLERTALNLLQRTCGVATLTRRFTDAIRGTRCRLLDTRKTSPGMRLIDKLAVRAGGGTNHRAGLYDAVLIKNNHIDAAGGVRRAWELCAECGVPREIEVRDFGELEEALACGADHILLDNFAVDEVREAVRRVAGRARIEVSGNLSLETIRAYAEAGADFASVGSLTHSAPAVDISFRLLGRRPSQHSG